MTANAPLLRFDEVSVRFGGIAALDRVSFELEEEQIVGLIGPNGAGKTTLFNCLTRLNGFQHGDILFAGRSIKGLRPHRMATLGIGRTFQTPAPFAGLSVLDNVLVALHCRGVSGFLGSALRRPSVRREEARLLELAGQLLAYLELEPYRRLLPAVLPAGVLKRLELARALAVEPRLLLLDEPAAGLGHDEVEGLAQLIREISSKRRIAILLVEHHIGLVAAVSDKVVALDFGRKIAECGPEEIRKNPAVVEAYLGGGEL